MIDRQENKVITLVGDGECHEGTIWESALVAQSLNLTNLCCIVDYNGSAAQILPHPSIAEQWRAFGWSVVEVNGHDPDEIETVVKKFYDEKELINGVDSILEGWWTEGYWNNLFEEKIKSGTSE